MTSDLLLVLRHDGKTSGPDVAVIEGTRVAGMSPSQLEALRRHLVNEKKWPEDRP